jgi:cytosine/adenosine deaminase-related metal-dependent hydrolase
VYGNNREFISGLPNHLQEYISKSPSSEGLSDKNFVEVIKDLYRKYNSLMCKIGFGPLAPQWCTKKLLLKVRKEAIRLNIPTHIHTLESVFQKIYSLKFLGKTLIAYLDDIDFLGKGITIGHCVWPTESDVHLLAQTGTGVTHQPSANLRLRTGIAPVAYMLQEGVCVGLGMDGTTINDNDDFVQEMKLCYLLHRLSSLEMDSSQVTARQIFKMGTENNAELVGYEKKLGRLEPGFLADLVLLDFRKICYPYVDPTQDPIDTLLYRGQGHHVDSVIVNGKVVVSDGQVLTLDEQAIGDRLAESAAKPMDGNEILKSKMMDELRKHIVKYYKNWITDLEFEPYWNINSRKNGLKMPL